MRLTIESLQPGFLVVYVPDEFRDRESIKIDGWNEMKANGWSGGLIVSDDLEFMSLSDHDLETLGLMRIPKQSSTENLAGKVNND